MKPHFLFAFVTLVFTFVSTLQADLTIVQDVQAQGQNLTMTSKFKADKIRIDLGEQATSIVDAKSGDVVTLMHGQKMAMKMSGNQLASLTKTFSNNQNTSDTEPELVATGNTETINGHECKEYTYQSDGTTITLLIAEDYPEKEKILKQMELLQESEFSKQVTGGKVAAPKALPGVPLKTTATGVQGSADTTVITIKDIQLNDIADSEFVVPDGYKEMAMPAMPQAPAGN